MAQAKPLIPDERMKVIARESSRKLARIMSTGEPVDFRVEGQDSISVVLPAEMVRMLKDMLVAMSRGDAITFVPTNAVMTTKQAADFLGVSRPYLIKMLNEGKIPYNLVGTHRRIAFKDLMDYKARRDSSRREALDEMARIDQELGM